jgi:hypothetical protein
MPTVVRTLAWELVRSWSGYPDWASACRSLESVSDHAGGRDDQTEGRGIILDNFEHGDWRVNCTVSYPLKRFMPRMPNIILGPFSFLLNQLTAF